MCAHAACLSVCVSVLVRPWIRSATGAARGHVLPLMCPVYCTKAALTVLEVPLPNSVKPWKSLFWSFNLKKISLNLEKSLDYQRSERKEVLKLPEVNRCSVSALGKQTLINLFPAGRNHLFLRQIIAVTAQIMLFHFPLSLPSASILPFALILVCKRPIWVLLSWDFVPWKNKK